MNVSTRARSGSVALAGLMGLVILLLAPVPFAAGAELITFSPAEGSVGEDVTITGAGWTPSLGPVEIYLPDQNASVDTPWVSAVVDEQGGFSADVPIPELVPGTYALFACQSCKTAGDAYPLYRPVLTVTAPPEAVPVLKLSPEQGKPGEIVDVAGSGWSIKDGTVLLFADETDSVDAELALLAVEPTADGTFSSTMPVPERSAGNYTFYACQFCDAKAPPSSTAPFEITVVSVTEPDPALTLDPTEGEAGQQITVRGTGWSDRAGPVSVYAGESAEATGAEPLATATVRKGAFVVGVQVPNQTPGQTTIYACQRCSDEGQLAAEAPFTITEVQVTETAVQVTPASARAGDPVTANGSGWRDGEPVSLFLRPSGTSGPGQELARADVVEGAFTISFQLPAVADGQYDMVACQRCGETDELSRPVSFTILPEPEVGPPHLAVDPGSAGPGERVTLTGSGWSPAEGAVAIFLVTGGPDGVRPGDGSAAWVSVMPRPDGTFALSAEVPERDAEAYVVRACQRCDSGAGSREATAALEITGSPEPPIDDGWLTGRLVAIVLVVAALGLAGPLTVRQLRRRLRTRRDRKRREPAVEPPQVQVFPDDALRVEVRESPGASSRGGLPTLDIVVHEVRVDLTTQLEVSP